MYPQIKFAISMSYSIGELPVHDLNRTEVKVTVTLKQYATINITNVSPQTNSRFLPQIIDEMCSGYDYSRTETRGQGQVHSDPKMILNT